MRPLKAILLSPARAVRRSVALVTRRVHLGRKRSRGLGGLHTRPTRRPGSLRWMRTVTVAGWFRRNENVVPRGYDRVVRPNSGVDFRPTLNTEWVSDSPEIVARSAASGNGSVPTVVPGVVPVVG